MDLAPNDFLSDIVRPDTISLERRVKAEFRTATEHHRVPSPLTDRSASEADETSEFGVYTPAPPPC